MNNDLISRSELKKHKVRSEERHEYVVPVYNIDNAPTVPLPDFKEGYKQAIIDGKTNFSRPQGEWIIVKDEKYGDNVKCPFCGKEIAGTDLNFCVKCGAKMQKEGAKMGSCEICMFKYQPEYCELNNKKLYGFCGNFTCLDDAVLLPRIYKCPKCLYLFNGRDDPDKCPRCGANVKKGGAE